MTNTFRIPTASGTVVFSVIGSGGCMYKARALAMDECDRQGWNPARLRLYIC